MELDQFLIREDASISAAFEKIDKNESGAVFIENLEKKVVGIATDGDIRRFLIKTPNMQESISSCMNRSFVYLHTSSSREQILKTLDHRIGIIPLLDDQGKITDVISKNDFPLISQKSNTSRAISPVRISFSGGGSDLTQNFMKTNGSVLNSTIKIYSHATLTKRDDSRVSIHSLDLNERIEVEHIEKLNNSGPLKLIQAVVNHLKPQFGFDLLVYSDFPVGSGLGGSSAVISAVIGCFNQFRSELLDSYEIAELAFQSERLSLGIAGGWQDQYATVFGGFNYMEFSSGENIVHPLRIRNDITLELEENLILCHTKLSHDSDQLHKAQSENMSVDERNNLLTRYQTITSDMKAMLLKGRLNHFGSLLGETWHLKKQFSSLVSSEWLDSKYNKFISAGAVGGRLLGAGGGGYFLFYVPPEKRRQFTDAVKEEGLDTLKIQFDNQGLQSWRVRNQK